MQLPLCKFLSFIRWLCRRSLDGNRIWHCSWGYSKCREASSILVHLTGHLDRITCLIFCPGPSDFIVVLNENGDHFCSECVDNFRIGRMDHAQSGREVGILRLLTPISPLTLDDTWVDGAMGDETATDHTWTSLNNIFHSLNWFQMGLINSITHLFVQHHTYCPTHACIHTHTHTLAKVVSILTIVIVMGMVFVMVRCAGNTGRWFNTGNEMV